MCVVNVFFLFFFSFSPFYITAYSAENHASMSGFKSNLNVLSNTWTIPNGVFLNTNRYFPPGDSALDITHGDTITIAPWYYSTEMLQPGVPWVLIPKHAH